MKFQPGLPATSYITLGETGFELSLTGSVLPLGRPIPRSCCCAVVPAIRPPSPDPTRGGDPSERISITGDMDGTWATRIVPVGEDDPELSPVVGEGGLRGGVIAWPGQRV